ncbi:Phosphorylase b kinase gamma catalytic chain, skeletal muscle/heart isoform [Microsporum audouinii]
MADESSSLSNTTNTDVSESASDLPSAPANVEIVVIHGYYPPGVTEIIGRSSGSFIGRVNESTVLKYPSIPGDYERIKIEAKFLAILGDHPRIISSKGRNEHGLALQYARNGNLYEHIISKHATISLSQKLSWCKQAAEAVKYIHEKRVIHWMLKSPHGKTLLDGLSKECTKSFMSRSHGDFADVKTDIFALGSAIYFIMLGHEVFPELDTFNDDEDEQVALLFSNGDFPTDDHACSTITDKCWRQAYESAEDIIQDISQIQI